MGEKDWQRQVMELAWLRGWDVCHFHDSRRQIRPGVFIGDSAAAGFPDLVLWHERYGVVFAELKTNRGRLRADQERRLYSLQRAGARVYVWRPADLTDVARVLAGQAVPAPPLAAPLRPGGAGTSTRRRIA